MLARNAFNPFQIILRINNYCNYKCEYCVNDIPYLNEPYKTIDIRAVKCLVYNINTYLRDCNAIVSIQGGEPTIANNIHDICKELLNIKNLYSIRVLSNCSVDVSKLNLNISDKIKFNISLHYDEMKRLGFDNSYNVMKDNIKYLIDNKMLLGVAVLQKNIDYNVFNTIKDDLAKIGVDDVCITPIIPTDNYKIDNFDYASNNHVINNLKKVYTHRYIYVNYDLSIGYTCYLAKDFCLHHKFNVISKDVWTRIAKNINNMVYCDNETCPCPCCFTEDEIIVSSN